jgi:hypothetical protein
LKKIYPSIIPAKFGLIWFSSFREEDLNVTVYGLRQTPSEGKALMVKNTHQNLLKYKNSNVQNFRIWALFQSKIANFLWSINNP